MNTQTRKSCFELRAAIEGIGATQRLLAEMCGVKEVQVWRWCEGKAPIPEYVWTILSLFQTDPTEVMFGERGHWKVTARHVYRNGKSYRVLAKRFHPDATGHDTTAEMQDINRLRDSVS